MGFFDAIWSGIKSVGSFIGSAIKPVANFLGNSGIPVLSSIGKGVSNLINVGENIAGRARDVISVGKRIAGGVTQFVGKRAQNLRANPIIKQFASRDFKTMPVKPEVPVTQLIQDDSTQNLYAK